MADSFVAGDAVQTPFGKGVVREVRNGARLLVDVGGRALVITAAEVSKVEPRRRRGAAKRDEERDATSGSPPERRAHVPSEIDLHGLTVEEALARVDDALNDALLGDLAQLRFIHGRSGGRIRAALHARLRGIASVRYFRVDPANDGVTIVEL